MIETMTDPATLHDAIREEVEGVLLGNETLVEGLTISLLTHGHVLLEGVPGVAKTTAANLFARASGMEYSRIQMTPDVLPADITGTHVYREHTGEFDLQRGPIFANVVVADEINRATPKTQSALLEAMAEERVTIEGETLELPEPFMVIATQNPLEMEGTFELPEAQRDRFQLKLTVSLPDRGTERSLLGQFDSRPRLSAEDVRAVVSSAEVLDARTQVIGIHVSAALKEYVLDVVSATREHPDIEHGGSPRASLAFLHTAKARAAIHGRDYVIPDDVKALAEPVLVHRLVMSTDAALSEVGPEEVIESVIERTDTPAGDATPATAVGDGGVPDGSSDE